MSYGNNSKHELLVNERKYGVGVADKGFGVIGGFKPRRPIMNFSPVLQGVHAQSIDSLYSQFGGNIYSPQLVDMAQPGENGRFGIFPIAVPPIVDPQLISTFVTVFGAFVKGHSGLQDFTASQLEGTNIRPNGPAEQYMGIVKDENASCTLTIMNNYTNLTGKLMEHWYGGMSDRETTFFHGNGANLPKNRSNYGFTFLYVSLGPTGTGLDIRFAALYYMMFPTSPIPIAQFNGGTLNQVQAAEPTIDVELAGTVLINEEVNKLAAKIVALSGISQISQGDAGLPSDLLNGGIFEIINNSTIEELRSRSHIPANRFSSAIGRAGTEQVNLPINRDVVQNRNILRAQGVPIPGLDQTDERVQDNINSVTQTTQPTF